MVFVVVGVVVVGLCVALVVFVAADPGPSAAEVALAYEYAWDHLDFEGLWALSGDELRDGLDRPAFIEAKRAAYVAAPDGYLLALAAPLSAPTRPSSARS